MNPAPKPLPLEGVGVLITRPDEQAEMLADRLLRLGANPVRLPVIDIADIADHGALNALIDRLHEFDWAIFISPTAAGRGIELIRARRMLPATLRIAAIGQGGARELARLGVNTVLTPGGRFDSEALLALPEMHDMAGRRVVVFRGEGGRELLADTLRARGARVEYAECYRRARPAAMDPAVLRMLARGALHAAHITSAEGLRNLFDMVGAPGGPWLRELPMFMPHPRIAQAARELGVKEAHAIAGGEDALIEALLERFAR
jgi:uroporphyrinogen-III synthase